MSKIEALCYCMMKPFTDTTVFFLFFFHFLPPDKYKGGIVAETDELIPEVEKALLQTERPNSLLRQRCQGTPTEYITVYPRLKSIN